MASKLRHTIIQSDSSIIQWPSQIGLVITSPPCFHPKFKKPQFGETLGNSIEEYTSAVSAILLRLYNLLADGKYLCIIKTDFTYKGRHFPLGFLTAQRCEQEGMNLLGHWMWVKRNYYSPYNPGFSNIFIFGKKRGPQLHFHGIINDYPEKKGKGAPVLFTPALYEFIISKLSAPGDTIVDPFLGTGSTLEASHRSGRQCIGAEISEQQIQLLKTTISKDIKYQITKRYGNTGRRIA